MNIKNKVIVASILIIAMIPLVVSNTFAQIYWPSCKISAYGNNVDFYTSSTTNQNRYQFTVRAPPEGSNITNTIEVANDDTGENYVETLSPGDVVYVNWYGISPSVNEYTPGEQMGYYTFNYEGAVAEVQINSIQIPEFSTTFFVILFMAIPLIAIIYSKKRIPQK